MSGAVVESTNYVLKKAYNGHSSSRGGDEGVRVQWNGKQWLCGSFGKGGF